MTRDLRQYGRQTTTQLFTGFFLIVFLIGDGLILLIYGRDAAILGLMCLAVGVFPIVLITLLLLVLDWVVKNATKE